MKTWQRATQKTKQFPSKKYGFSDYLKTTGSYLITESMTDAAYQKIKDAAKFWAWYHDKRVTIRKNKNGDGTCFVVITLVAHHRK
jgi:hypothetical protein